MREFDFYKDLYRQQTELSPLLKDETGRKIKMNRLKISENPEQFEMLTKRSLRMFNKMFRKTGPRSWEWILSTPDVSRLPTREETELPPYELIGRKPNGR